MKNVFLLVSVLFGSINMLAAQGGMNLGCTDCAIENRWQSNQYIEWSNGVINYTQNTSGTYPGSQVWQFEHVANEPSNIFRIKNSSGYIVRDTLGGITIQSSPATNEDDHWEVFVRNGFYFLLAPCELKGMHIENLNGNIQYGDLSLGWHSAQWILKDANGGSSKRGKTTHEHHSHETSPTIGMKTPAGSTLSLQAQLKSKSKNASLKLSKNTSIDLKVNLTNTPNDSITFFIGSAEGNDQCNFILSESKGHVEGTVLDYEHKRAYKIKESGTTLISEEVDIDEIVCIGTPQHAGNGPVTNMTTRGCDIPANTDVTTLNSLPGAAAVIYLDFDGENVTNSWWNGGTPVNAQPMELSDGWIYAIWQGIVEDFMPFDVTVTTDINVYNAAPLGQKTQVIFTNTNFTTYGGVAYINSFNWTFREEPCWVFNDFSLQGIWDTGSHEIGHTLGLGHDGRSTPSEEYYAGHEDWGPIMGVSWDRQLSQWSIGEYQNANNTQDDLAIITKAVNDINFRADDIPTTKTLGLTPTGTNTFEVNDGGIIERNTDTDQFTFTLNATSDVNLYLSPAAVGPNLNIGVRILQGSQEIANLNPEGPDNSVSLNLAAGSYILEVDGVGERDTLTDGYSDYASLGTYTIQGTIEEGQSTGDNYLTIFNVPQSGGIPTGFRQYSNVHTLGTSGPDLSNVFNSVFSWYGNQQNPNALYQFTLETNNGQPRHYTNIPDYGSYSLLSYPEISINSSIGFTNLDGDYWVTLDGSNLVLVEKSGDYALYFSNSSTPPNVSSGAKEGTETIALEAHELLGYPNPFSNAVNVVIPKSMGNCKVTVSDINGLVLDTFNAAGEITLGEAYKAGVYSVSVTGNNETKQLKVVKY